MSRLAERIAIITGGGRGIGRAIAKRFVAAIFLASDESSAITGERIAVDDSKLFNGYRIYGVERPRI